MFHGGPIDINWTALDADCARHEADRQRRIAEGRAAEVEAERVLIRSIVRPTVSPEEDAVHRRIYAI